MNENVIGKDVVDAAVKVHRERGAGLLEAVYEVVLAKELQARGLRVERQVPVAIVYDGVRSLHRLRLRRIGDLGVGRYDSDW